MTTSKPHTEEEGLKIGCSFCIYLNTKKSEGAKDIPDFCECGLHWAHTGKHASKEIQRVLANKQ